MSDAVSVVITFYNSDATFPEALRSVLTQSRAPAEIIVVDDASDPSRSRTLEDLPSSVTLLKLDRNVGAGAARQAGSRIAVGEWIAYLDADDAWHPDKLERQIAHIVAEPDLGATHCGTSVVRNGQEIAQYIDKPQRLTPEVIVRGGQVLPSSLMIRRDVLELVGGWTTDRYVLEDWDLAIRLVLAGVEIGFLPEALTMFRRDGHGNFTSDPWNDLTIHLACIDRHKRVMTEYAGPRHITDLQLKYLRRFAWKLPRWPGRMVRAGAWLLERQLRTTAPPQPS